MTVEQSNSEFSTEDKVKDLTRKELKDKAKNANLDVSDLRKETKDGLDRLGTSTKQFNDIAEAIYKNWENNNKENENFSINHKKENYNEYIGTPQYISDRNVIINQIVGQDIDTKKMSTLKQLLDHSKYSLNSLEEEVLGKGEIQRVKKDEGKDVVPQSNKRIYDEALLSQDENGNNNAEEQEKQISKRDVLGVAAFLNGVDKVRGPQRGMLKLLYRTMNRIDNHKVNGPNDFSTSELMKYFSKNIGKLNYTENEIEENIGAGVDEKDMRRINKLAKFYNEAHQQNKYPIFRRITALLEQSNDMVEFVGKFDDSMKEFQEQDNFSEKRSARKLEKEDKEFADFTKKLGISANLAYKMFQKADCDEKNLDDIIDFNRDGFINYGDAGNKTAIQIKEFAKLYEEATAVDKLTELGKQLAKKSGDKWISLDTKQQIIYMQLAIQNASNLNHIFRDTNEVVSLAVNKEEIADAVAKKEVNDLVNTNPDLQKAIDDGTVTLEGLQQTTATALINSYQKGLGVGINIPFDKYVKNVSLSMGVSAGKLIEGKPEDFLSIALSYNKNIDLGKGWGAGVGVSAGTTLAVIPYASIGGELSKEVGNGKIAWEKKYKRIAVGGNVTVMPGLVVLGGKAGIDTNRAENLARQAEAIKSDITEFADNLLKLKDINTAKIKKFLKEQHKDKNEMKEETLTEAANLLNQIILTLPEENKKEVLAETLSNAWYNKGIAKMSSQGWYLSGGSVGLQIANAIPILSAALRFRKTKFNGYNDTAESVQKVEAGKKGVGNIEVNDLNNKTAIDNEIIDRVEKKLGLNEGITISDNTVTINKTVWTEKGVTLVLDPSMEKNVKIDANGNLQFHIQTPIRPLVNVYGDSVEKQLNIGNFENVEVATKLSATSSLPGRFKIATTENLSPNSNGKITKKSLKEALDRGLSPMTVKVYDFINKEDGSIAFNIDGKDYTLAKGQKFVINRSKKGNAWSSERICSVEDAGNENKLPYIEVKTQTEKIPGLEVPLEVSKTLTDFYGEVKKVQSNALRNIAHKKATSQLKKLYDNWRENLNNQKYEAAKKSFLGMLEPMQAYINSHQKTNPIDLAGYKNKINAMQFPELDQFLLGIDGIFSRTTNVKYNEKQDMAYKLEFNQKESDLRTVTDSNLNRMKNRLIESANKLVPGAGAALMNLFDIVKGRQNELLKKGEYDTDVIENAIGCNFGNPDAIARFITNPEIVANSMIHLDDLKNELGGKIEGSDYTSLKRYFITNLVKNNEAILSPMIAQLEKEGYAYDENNFINALEEKKIDIKGKIRNIKYDLGFAYFAQCANHMLTIQNLSIDGEEIPGEKIGDKQIPIATEGKVYQENIGETTSKAESYDSVFDAGLSVKLKDKSKNSGGSSTPNSDSDGETVPDGEENDKDINHDNDVDETKDNNF